MADRAEHRKHALRDTMRSHRAALSTAQLMASAEGLRAQLDAVVRSVGARTVSCYLSAGNEPGTDDFVAGAAANGIRVLLPISRPDGRLDWVWAGGGITTGLFGIPEPVGTPVSPETVSELDLMLIPAAAVDRSGMRLGWGRGYFDRTLSALDAPPPVYAVVYDDELLESVPTEPHDQPVTGVVTPTQTIVLAPAAR